MAGSAWIGLAAAMSSLNFFISALCITSSGEIEERFREDDFRHETVLDPLVSWLLALA